MLFNDVLHSFHPPAALIERIAALKLPKTVNLHAQSSGYDLLIYDVIGCGCVEADDIVQALAMADGEPVRVRINSPGGDAFSGFAIYNVLNSYPGELSVVVDGVAASAAAYLAMAGSNILMQPASFFMIHNGWTVTVGDRNRLQSQIGALSKIDATQAQLFSDKTGMSKEEIGAMLDVETWFTAQETVDQGFADGIVKDLPAQPELPSDPDADETADAQAMMPMNFIFDKRKRLLAARLLKHHNNY